MRFSPPTPTPLPPRSPPLLPRASLYVKRATQLINATAAKADTASPLFLYVAFAHTHTPLAYNPRWANASVRPGWYKVKRSNVHRARATPPSIHPTTLTGAFAESGVWQHAGGGGQCRGGDLRRARGQGPGRQHPLPPLLGQRVGAAAKRARRKKNAHAVVAAPSPLVFLHRRPADLGSVACEAFGSPGPFVGNWQRLPTGGRGGEAGKSGSTALPVRCCPSADCVSSLFSATRVHAQDHDVGGRAEVAYPAPRSLRKPRATLPLTLPPLLAGRVPGLAIWPGVVAPGTRSNALVGSIDVFPTLAKAAGAALPSGVCVCARFGRDARALYVRG